MFETPGQPCPGGGITLVKKGEFVSSKGKGGVMLYLYVAGLEGWEEVCLDYIFVTVPLWISASHYVSVNILGHSSTRLFFINDSWPFFQHFRVSSVPGL